MMAADGIDRDEPGEESSMINVGSLLVMIAVGGLVAYIVIQPISKASRTAKPLERFFMVDIISLVLLLQIPLVFLSIVARMREPSEVAITGAFLVIMVIAIWWRGVSLLSSLGIFGNTRRLVFIVFILPIALLGSMATYPMFLVVFHSLAEDFEVETPGYLIVMSFAGLFLLPFAIFFLRMLTHWILAEPRRIDPEMPEPPPIDPLA